MADPAGGKVSGYVTRAVESCRRHGFQNTHHAPRAFGAVASSRAIRKAPTSHHWELTSTSLSQACHGASDETAQGPSSAPAPPPSAPGSSQHGGRGSSAHRCGPGVGTGLLQHAATHVPRWPLSGGPAAWGPGEFPPGAKEQGCVFGGGILGGPPLPGGCRGHGACLPGLGPL